MATPALTARIPASASRLDVLYTDAPAGPPGTLLKTVPAQRVAVPTDPVFVAGGGRLVLVTLGDDEIRPDRRFAFRAHAPGQAPSGVSVETAVPTQLVDAAGAPLFDVSGDPLIPAPVPGAPGQLTDADGAPLYDADGFPLYPS